MSNIEDPPETIGRADAGGVSISIATKLDEIQETLLAMNTCEPAEPGAEREYWRKLIAVNLIGHAIKGHVEETAIENTLRIADQLLTRLFENHQTTQEPQP